MKAFIFDLDGTISDSVPLILSVGLQTCRHFGLDCSPQLLRSYIGFSLFETGEDILGPGRGQEYADTYSGFYHSVSHQLQPFPGVPQMLEQLRAAGARLALCTAKREKAARESLAQIGAAPYMDAVVYSELTQRHKPFPDPALEAARQLQLPPEQCLFVGDAKHDLGCGHSAGMAVCAVTWGAGTRQELEALQPEFTVDSVEQLRLLLLKQLKN